MALIINIDTATEKASVCLSNNGNCLSYKENLEQKEHASFIHVAIQEILKETGTDIKSVDAFAVTGGPGSYTGIRVGMATAKGFCFTLAKPLIIVNTLMVMAEAAKNKLLGKDNISIQNSVLCPMIDARRMEVYMCLYDFNHTEIKPPCAAVIDEDFLKTELNDNMIIVFGSGSKKFKEISKSGNALFYDIEHSAKELSTISTDLYKKSAFSDLAYAEPVYLKDFFSTQKDVKSV